MLRNIAKAALACLVIPAFMMASAGCSGDDSKVLKSENERISSLLQQKEAEVKRLSEVEKDLNKKINESNEEIGRLKRILTDAGLSENPDETKLNDCKQNLVKISTGLRLFAAENGGKFPKKLAEISPNPKYLDFVPTCPSASRDTYTSGYKPAKDLKSYVVYCNGCNHESVLVKENNPAFDSENGIQVERDKERKVKDEFDEASDAKAKDAKDESKTDSKDESKSDSKNSEKK